MRVNERVEEHVREAFGGAVGEDGDRMTAALNGLSGEESVLAFSYAFYVVGFILNDVMRSGPTDEDLDVIAGRAIEAVKGWINLGDKADIVTILRGAAEGVPPADKLPAEDLFGSTFVLGAYLLQVYRTGEQKWWDYLDDIWNTAESDS